MRDSLGTGLQPFAFAAAILACSASSMSWAQQAGGEAGLATLEEVIITAQKREENLQKTPVAVATVSQEDLVRLGATQLADLEKAIPDVKLNRQGSSALTVAIRGVFSTDTSPTSEAANAVHINGNYLAKTRGLDGFLFDLARVEVAKGPQGTLYGRNANGGTINFITNRPVIGERQAGGDIEVGSYNLLRASGAINVPLSSTVSLRGAFQTLSHRGYLVNGQDDADQKSGRISLLWKPDDVQSLLIVGDTFTNEGRGGGTNVVAQNGTAQYIPPNPRDQSWFTVPYDTATGLRSANPLADSYLRDRNYGLSMQYDRDVGFATWTTQAAYRHFDSDLRSINGIGQGPAQSGFPTAGRNHNPQFYRSESVESRLVSSSTRPVEWVVGLYGFHDRDGGTMVSYANPYSNTPGVEIANGEEIAKSYAGFGQATWTPTGVDRLHIVAGARYTRDQKDVSGIFTRFGVGPAAVVAPKSKTWSKTTYKVGLSFDVTDKSLLYGNYSTGYKAGGFAYGPGVNAADGPEYKPETIKAIELGSKNRFFDDRLQVNLEGWQYKYNDYQTNVTLFSPASPLPVLTATSAGSATYRGGSINVQWALTSSDLLALSYMKMSAKYDDNVITPPAGFSLVPGNPTATISYSGTPITLVPTSSGNANYTHTWKLASGSVDAQVAATYRGDITFAVADDGPYGRVYFTDKPFALYDASVRYQSDSGWSLTAYMHNVADSLHYRGGAYSAQTHLYTASFFDPRTVGLVFSVKIQ
jgi:iron complex outermembrane receptor protein